MKTLRVTAIGGLLALIAGLALPNSASAADEDVAADSQAGWYAVGPDGEVFDPNAPGLWEEPAPEPEPGTVSPMLIDDPVTWAACFTYNIEDFPIVSYQYYPPSGGPMIIELQCGYSTGHGWKHIQAGHQSQWQDRINSAGGGANWDDFMSWANETILGWPMTDVPDGTNKRCVSAPIMMYDRQGTFLFTFWPTVAVSTNNLRIITSIPTTSTNCNSV